MLLIFKVTQHACIKCHIMHIYDSDIAKSTSPRSLTSKNGGRKTLVVAVLLSGKKLCVGNPSVENLMLKKIRSCKTVGGPVRREFFKCLPVLWSGKGQKVFAMSDDFYWNMRFYALTHHVPMTTILSIGPMGTNKLQWNWNWNKFSSN